MSTELEIVLVQIENANIPEEVFGDLTGDLSEALRKIYRKIQRIIHPDHAGDSERVHKASAKLNGFYADARKKIQKSVYGDNKPLAPESPVVIKTKRNSYTLGTLIKIGATCGVFNALVQDKKGNALHGIVKVPHSPADNDLMTREAESLKKIKTSIDVLKGEPGGEEKAGKLMLLFPRILESLKLDPKIVNVFVKTPSLESNWYTLEQIHAKWPGGVTLRQAVFMMNRMLQALEVSHVLGIRHGCVLPKHVLIHRPSHAGQLVDWTCSGTTGNLPYLEKAYEGFYAPEVYASKTPTMDADVYSAAMNMIYVLGGDVNKFEVPDLPDPIRVFLNKCLQPRRLNRFRNAGQAYAAFKEAAESVLGPPQFVELVM